MSRATLYSTTPLCVTSRTSSTNWQQPASALTSHVSGSSSAPVRSYTHTHKYNSNLSVYKSGSFCYPLFCQDSRHFTWLPSAALSRPSTAWSPCKPTTNSRTGEAGCLCTPQPFTASSHVSRPCAGRIPRCWIHSHLQSKYESLYDLLSLVLFILTRNHRWLCRRYRSTPLLLTAMSGSLEALDYLLSNGACWRTPDSEGNNVVQLAALYFHTDLLRRLIQLNPDGLPVWRILTGTGLVTRHYLHFIPNITS